MSRCHGRSDSPSKAISSGWRPHNFFACKKRDRSPRISEILENRRDGSGSHHSPPSSSESRRNVRKGDRRDSYSQHEIQDTIDRKVAEGIKRATEQRVTEYVQSENFLLTVESFKRREREKMMMEIQYELKIERELLLNEGRKLMNSHGPSLNKLPINDSGSSGPGTMEERDNLPPEVLADAILLQNKRSNGASTTRDRKRRRSDCRKCSAEDKWR